MSTRPSTKTQKEEKWAVMRPELLWAVSGLKDEEEATRWGAYEGGQLNLILLLARDA
jgi:hypothetical protein